MVSSYPPSRRGGCELVPLLLTDALLPAVRAPEAPGLSSRLSPASQAPCYLRGCSPEQGIPEPCGHSTTGWGGEGVAQPGQGAILLGPALRSLLVELQCAPGLWGPVPARYGSWWHPSFPVPPPGPAPSAYLPGLMQTAPLPTHACIPVNVTPMGRLAVPQFHRHTQQPLRDGRLR